MKPLMRMLIAALICLAATVTLASPAHALSSPRYPEQAYPEIVPGQIAAWNNLLAVYDYGSNSIQVLSVESWEARSFTVGGEPWDIILNDEWLVAGQDSGLKIIYLKAGEVRDFETPARVEDLGMDEGIIWASIPLQDQILGIDPSSLEIVRRFEVDVAPGREKISAANGLLWIVESDGKIIVKMDLRSGSRSSLRLEEAIVALKAFKGGALAATTEDKIIEISEDLKIRRSWSLEKGSAAEIQLYRLDDGRVIYVSPSRWVIGEIEGDKIVEAKAESRIGGSALAEDRVWFTEPTKMRIGYAPLSRPPRITEFRVERIGGNLFKAYAEVDDPEGDLAKVYLIVFYPELMGAAQNRSYEMDLVDGSYVKEFEVDYGRRAEVHVSAVDRFNNLGRSGTISVKAEEVKTITSQQTTQISQGTSITPAEVYALGSSLLLLLPIIMALVYLRGRRRKRRKRKVKT